MTEPSPKEPTSWQDVAFAAIVAATICFVVWMVWK